MKLPSLKPSRGLLALALLVLATVVRADPPTYGGGTFDGLQVVIDDAALFFGVVTALAIVVTGFFLGRRWLRSVG